MSLKTIGRFAIPDVLNHVGDGDREYDGWVVRMSSLRYQTFRRSLRCAQCGMEATHFLLQMHPQMRTNPPNRAHFNLYSERPDGRMVLFTKDHIVPKSKGGPDKLHNFQTMCQPCNAKKADQEVSGPGPFHPVQ